MKSIQIPSAHLGEQNIFEEISELLERHRLNFEEDFPLGNFYDVVNYFDIAFQEFNSEEGVETNIQIYNDLLNYTVGNLLEVFKMRGFQNEPIFYAFKRFIVFFTLVLSEAGKHKNEQDIIRNFLDNFPSLKIKIRTPEENLGKSQKYEIEEDWDFNQDAFIKLIEAFSLEIGVTAIQPILANSGGRVRIGPLNPKFRELFIQAETGDTDEYLLPLSSRLSVKDGEFVMPGTILADGASEPQLRIYCNEFIGKTVVWNEDEQNYDTIEEQFYMNLDVSIETDDKSVERLFSPVWLITSALEKIDNVTLELEAISKGSLKASIRIWMKGLLAKEETKAVLETSKEAAVKALTGGQVSYTEVKKSRAETKKLSLENTLLETEVSQSRSDSEVKFERALDIQKKMLENEKLQIENAKAKIEIINKLSELATKGIIEADMIRIDINDILYLLKEKDELKQIGPDISEIT